MARRNTGLLNDLFTIASSLPWWLSLALAPVTYLLIHPFAGIPAFSAIRPGQLGQMAVSQFIQMGAFYGQMIIPAILLIGSLTAVLSQAKRQRIYRVAKGKPGKVGIEGISWHEFEMLVGEWFRRNGYSVRETNTGPDGGVDLALTRDGETYLVQCKQWKAHKVGVNIVREHLGVMVSQGAAGGFIVTSGVFTEEARRFAETSSIRLIDGDRLAAMIKSAKANTSLSPLSKPEARSAMVTCPACGADMVERKATRGTNAGGTFWGCSRYPKCRATRAR
jgi:restriction system protein